jgi:4-alpha-glucanotransferase
MLDWTAPADEVQPPATHTNDPPLLPLLRKVAASPARLVIVNVEDLWQETIPQNIPGTSTERPNWRHKARYTLEEFAQLPDVATAIDTVAQARNNREAEAPVKPFEG